MEKKKEEENDQGSVTICEQTVRSNRVDPVKERKTVIYQDMVVIRTCSNINSIKINFTASCTITVNAVDDGQHFLQFFFQF